MYNKNDVVLYGAQGICKIIDIADREMCHEKINYYVLKPVNDQHSTLYIPTENQMLTNKMKTVLSKEEVYELIDEMPNKELIWIEELNTRKEKYTEILNGGNRRELIKLIETLYLHQKELRTVKKRLYTADEKILKEATSLLNDEFSYVLDIEKDEVQSFIAKKIKSNKKQNRV